MTINQIREKKATTKSEKKKWGRKGEKNKGVGLKKKRVLHLPSVQRKTTNIARR